MAAFGVARRTPIQLLETVDRGLGGRPLDAQRFIDKLKFMTKEDFEAALETFEGCLSELTGAINLQIEALRSLQEGANNLAKGLAGLRKNLESTGVQETRPQPKGLLKTSSVAIPHQTQTEELAGTEQLKEIRADIVRPEILMKNLEDSPPLQNRVEVPTPTWQELGHRDKVGLVFTFWCRSSSDNLDPEILHELLARHILAVEISQVFREITGLDEKYTNTPRRNPAKFWRLSVEGKSYVVPTVSVDRFSDVAGFGVNGDEGDGSGQDLYPQDLEFCQPALLRRFGADWQLEDAGQLAATLPAAKLDWRKFKSLLDSAKGGVGEDPATIKLPAAGEPESQAEAPKTEATSPAEATIVTPPEDSQPVLKFALQPDGQLTVEEAQSAALQEANIQEKLVKAYLNFCWTLQQRPVGTRLETMEGEWKEALKPIDIKVRAVWYHFRDKDCKFVPLRTNLMAKADDEHFWFVYESCARPTGMLFPAVFSSDRFTLLEPVYEQPQKHLRPDAIRRIAPAVFTQEPSPDSSGATALVTLGEPLDSNWHMFAKGTLGANSD